MLNNRVVGAPTQHNLTQCPVVALSLAAALARDLHEALVQAEIVPDRVLPALLVLLKVRELGRDELIDLAERGPFRGRVLNGHRDQRHVAVWRLGVCISIRGITIVGRR